MYDKKGHIKLETSATVHKKIDTDISFNQTDVGTSTLVFQITRNGKPLEINNKHVDATIFMTNGNPKEDDKAMYVYDKLEIQNPEAGLARYKIPDEFLSQIGKVKAQVYLLIKG
ncbi:MAG: phage baseplate upper protein, partial [Atopostipes sp.]|nr:phage baseplate upper protein [Atopostipes sp.]